MARQTMIQKYAGQRAIGVYAGNGMGGGWVLLDIIHGVEDCAVAGYYVDSRLDYVREYKINYNLSGRPYIRAYGLRMHLDDFMRI